MKAWQKLSKQGELARVYTRFAVDHKKRRRECQTRVWAFTLISLLLERGTLAICGSLESKQKLEFSEEIVGRDYGVENGFKRLLKLSAFRGENTEEA